MRICKSTDKLKSNNKNAGWPVAARAAPLLLLSVTIAFLCAGAAALLWQQDNTVTHENRVIENTQAFFLLLATALHALQTGRHPISVKVPRICHMVLAMLCLSILVREIDIDRLGPQPGWSIAENLIRLSGGAAWIWLMTHVYHYRQQLWRNRARILLTSTSLLTGLGVLLYMTSWFFDKSVVPLPPNLSQLWEETLQMSGTVFFFTAALRRIETGSI